MYPSTNIWETDTLIFSEENPTAGYFDDDENWIQGTVTEVTAVGSLQPFLTTSIRRIVLPRGVKEEDARLFYTKASNLKSAKDSTRQEASVTTINGEEYYIEEKGDWSRLGTYLKHYVYLLVKRPQNPLTSDT